MIRADAPSNWPDPPPTSMLETLLVFVGIPLLVVVVISLLVMAPSLARGPRLSPGQPWDAEPEWFGAPEPGAVEATPQRPQLAGAAQASGATRAGGSSVAGTERRTGPVVDADNQTGGASVRW